MRLKSILATALTLMTPMAGLAEVELSFYGGAQNAPHSDVFISGDDAYPAETFIGWEGRSFDAPPYYGIRATVWQSANIGYGVDFTHNKIYPQAGELDGTPFETLEFTDGLNTLTLNAYRRWQGGFGNFTPYVGGGVGLAIPHVEVSNGQTETFGYQITGPAATWIAGASYPITDTWAVFGEYKGTYSQNTAELDGGGTLETDVITNAVNVGVSFSF